MNTTTMPAPLQMKTIFPHEDSPLYRRACALHAYAARLAAAPNAVAGRRAFERAANSAFMMVAAAGVAVSAKDCSQTLCRARKWLAKCVAAVTGLLHKADITPDVASLAHETVEAVNAAMPRLPVPGELGLSEEELRQGDGDAATPAGELTDREASAQSPEVPAVSCGASELAALEVPVDIDLQRPPPDGALTHDVSNSERRSTIVQEQGGSDPSPGPQ